ncbi:hypothetical protein Tco_0850313 [Tanacetum coccineum]
MFRERLPTWHSSVIQSWEGHRILLLSAGERDNQRRDKGNVTMNEDRDSASPSTAEANVVGPSQPAGEELRSMDYEQLFAEFNVGAARQTCLGAEVRMRLEHEIRGRKRFEGKCAIQDGWLKERDAEIASLKAQLSLKEDKATDAIRLRGQVAVVEAATAA